MYHMVVISIFTLSHIDDTGGDDSITEDERHFRDVVVTFIGEYIVLIRWKMRRELGMVCGDKLNN